jgi:osmotically-inducible protein OsmY
VCLPAADRLSYAADRGCTGSTPPAQTHDPDSNQDEERTMSRLLLKTTAAAIVAIGLAACSATSTKSSTGEWFDDTWITTKVKTSLLADENTSGTAINVETFRGMVQLSGFAASQGEIERAVKIAQGTAGVKGVKNDIRLRAATK